MTPLNETTASNRHCSRLYKSLTPATNTDDGGFRPMKDFVCSPESGSMAGDQRASVGPNPIRDSDYAQEGPSRSGGTTKAECNYPPGTSPADRPMIGVSDALIGSSQGVFPRFLRLFLMIQPRSLYLTTIKMTSIATAIMGKKRLDGRDRRPCTRHRRYRRHRN